MLYLEVIGRLKRNRLADIDKKLDCLNEVYEGIRKDRSLVHKALAKERLLPVPKILCSINRSIDEVVANCQICTSRINSSKIKEISASDIIAELEQSEEELGPLDINITASSLSVTTDPVVLENVDLGPFEIRLYIKDIADMGNMPPYSIIALEPNPASTDPEVTHPHVKEQMLCEGEGYYGLRRCLIDGRLFDFFSMVINILNTYNPESPYVALEDWQSQCCYDCNQPISDDESYYCEHCGYYYCDYCSSYCGVCEETICMGCLQQCPQCGKQVCSQCVKTCTQCHRILCEDCFSEEQICDKCNERKEQNDEEYDQRTNIDTEIHSGGMGQTCVSP
jgi:hypothetical protein